MIKRFVIALLICLVTSSIVLAAPDNALIQSNGNGMVVSTQPLADMAGQAILDNGGNAIDAAVAVGYALAVVHPQAGNIGGGGFAVIHTSDGNDYALDFREMAPVLEICILTNKATLSHSTARERTRPQVFREQLQV